MSQSTLRFSESRLIKADRPDWYIAIEEDGPDPSVENFGGDGDADSIEIYRGPDGDWFVQFFDRNGMGIAEVLVDNADYLQFRATYIAPLANLIMELERRHALSADPDR